MNHHFGGSIAAKDIVPRAIDETESPGHRPGLFVADAHQWNGKDVGVANVVESEDVARGCDSISNGVIAFDLSCRGILCAPQFRTSFSPQRSPRLAFTGVASAADLPARTYTKAPEYASTPMYDWTGFYLGGAIGGIFSDANRTTTCQEPGSVAITNCVENADRLANNNPQKFDVSSFKAGIYGGYNWQVGRSWLVGLEGDVNWLDLKRTNVGIPGLEFPGNDPGGDSSSVKQAWDASLRARIGFLVTPSILLYGTGGAAFTQVDVAAHCGSTDDAITVGWCINTGNLGRTDTTRFNRIGWTLGAGVEAMIAPNWLLRGQYLYADYGTLKFTQLQDSDNTDAYSGTVRYRTQSATIGIAYKFGGPAVARY